MTPKKPEPTPEELVKQYADVFFNAGWLPPAGIDEAVRQRVETKLAQAGAVCAVCGHQVG
jgi:hypothetical protein